ncbi:MAG: hypothetical protein KF752_04350 [Pirellulaceae bacterium]|nr:hypothetical protein [Pirellulaceae bacterium]
MISKFHISVLRTVTISLLLLAGLGWPSQLLACRYTVRDIGFAPLHDPEFSLVITWSHPNWSPELSSPVRPAQWLQPLKTLLADSNVAVVSRYAEAGGSAKETDVVQETSTAVVTSVSLQDRYGRRYDLSQSFQKLTAPSQLTEWLNAHIFTALLSTISRQATHSFALIVVVQGGDPAENERAILVADQAGEALKKVERLLPRPIGFPVGKVIVHPAQRGQQPMLLWALGDDRQYLPGSAKLAVVYGRGRLAGPVLHGQEIDLRSVLAQLALVGQSCECQGDHAWTELSSLPVRWSATEREELADQLGFNPASPLVQAEMLRIVSQSRKTSSNSGTSSAASRDAIERLLIGYSETDLTRVGTQRPSDDANTALEFNPAAQADTSPANASKATGSDSASLGTGLKAQIITGDGWGFETVPSTTEPKHALDSNRSSDQEADAMHRPVIVGRQEADQIGAPTTLRFILLSAVLIVGLTIVAVICWISRSGFRS